MVAASRLSAVVALACALAFPGAAAAGANLFANGTFEGTLAGWGGNLSTLSLAGDGIVGGSGAARVTFRGGGTSFSIAPGPRPVRSTVAGTAYTAAASVRSATPGRKICLRIREWSPANSLLGAAQGCATSTAAWQQLPRVSYRTTASSGTLDAYVYESGAVAGDSFEVDGVKLVVAAAPADTTPPVATIVSAPSGTLATGSASISFTSEPGATFSCSLDGSAWGACSSPASYGGLADGPHSFSVRAADAAGNVQVTPTTATWTVAVLLSPVAWTPTWLNPFPRTSVWNTPLPPDPALDPQSAAKIAYLVQNAVNPNMAIHAWTTPVVVASDTSPRYTVPCTMYRCTLGAFGAVPIPRGSLPDPQGDAHLVVWDRQTHREWDLWQASYDASSDRWSASAGAAVSTDGDGIAPAGTAAGDAANFPLLGGLIRPEEIEQGQIDHALVFAMPNVAAGAPRCPATHNAGSSTNPAALPEGTHLQLDPALDVDALQAPAWQKTIMKALQKYGMYLRDGGGSLALAGENPINRGYDAWAEAGISTANGSVRLTAIPWARMRVIAAPSYPSC